MSSQSSNEAVLVAERVSKQVISPEGGLTILSNVGFTIFSGESVAITGASGAGKSTLLALLAGLDLPSEGRIWLNGNELTALDEDGRARIRAASVGFVFQSFGLLPTLSAYENVELMLRIKGVSSKERHNRSMYCLELVGLKKWVHHRPYELSGGQQQRVAIARSLANQPNLILADEPTGELDSETAREILGLFQQIVIDENITILMASHDGLVDDYVDMILQLRDGQVVTD